METAPPSAAMAACRELFRRELVRTVWDIGCGIGRWSVFLAKAGFQVRGSDFAENGIRYAANWAKEEGLDIEFACCPITKMPFPDVKFDAVVAALVLDNATREEMECAAAHIHGGLREGGRLFAVFNPHLTQEDIERLKASDNPTKGVTSVVYTDGEIRKALRDFEILEAGTYEQDTRGFLFRRLRQGMTGTGRGSTIGEIGN